jgi:probable phosphoglycerate mutase
MNDTRIVLVRHGESVATVERYLGGLRTCRGLTEHGRAQAQALGARLQRTKELQVDAIVSSSFPRAMQTADIVAPFATASSTFVPGSVSTTQALTAMA